MSIYDLNEAVPLDGWGVLGVYSDKEWFIVRPWSCSTIHLILSTLPYKSYRMSIMLTSPLYDMLLHCRQGYVRHAWPSAQLQRTYEGYHPGELLHLPATTDKYVGEYLRGIPYTQCIYTCRGLCVHVLRYACVCVSVCA